MSYIYYDIYENSGCHNPILHHSELLSDHNWTVWDTCLILAKLFHCSKTRKSRIREGGP